jgi:glycosyltransferase involved in cell wall biosynthesis
MTADVIMLGEYYFPNNVGGAEVQAMRRAEGLVKAGLSVTVISFDRNGGKKEEIINGVNVIRYDVMTHTAKMLSLTLPVVQALRKNEKQTDLYHIYNVHPLAGGGLYRVTQGRNPVIATLDNFGGYCPTSTAIYKKCDLLCRYSCLNDFSRSTREKVLSMPYAGIYPLLTSLTKKVDRYIAVTEYVKHEYIKHGYNQDRITVIPNSVDIGKIGNGVRSSHEYRNILYVGRMVSPKGVDILIRAFHKASRYYHDLRLILVGSGEKLNQYRSLIKNLGIESKVTVAGFVAEPELWHYYSIADLFVSPSIAGFEVFGITLLEALRYHIPCLVPDTGGGKEVIKDAGVTFRDQDEEDLMKKMMLILNDNQKSLVLSARCEDVLSEYSDEKVLKRLVKVYDDVRKLCCNH